MKLGLFADPHYCKKELLCSNRRPILSLGKIREALEAFQKAEVDYCVCLGDLTDRGDSHEETEQCLREAMELIRASALPFLFIPGNHDYAEFTAEALAAHTGCPAVPYTVETDSHLLIFLDASYRSDFRRYDIAGVDWKDSNLPPEQLEFLRQTLETAIKPCILFLHENLDPHVQIDHIIKNASVARSILEESGKVPLVIQGHYHPGADHTISGIRYLTLPAMCEGTENHYCVLEI